MSNDKISNSTEPKKEKLHTEGPLSEKDEVKDAEHRTAKLQKAAQSSVSAELKNRESDKSK